jgi:hypothetical protein
MSTPLRQVSANSHTDLARLLVTPQIQQPGINADFIHVVAFTEGYCLIVQLLSLRTGCGNSCDLFEYGVDRRPRKTDYVNSHTVLLYIIAINTVSYNA